MFMFMLFLIATLKRVWKVKPLPQPKIENMEIISSFNEPCLGELQAVLNNWTDTPLRVLSIIHLRKGIMLVYYSFLMVRKKTDICGCADDILLMIFLKCLWILFRWCIAFSKSWWPPYLVLKQTCLLLFFLTRNIVTPKTEIMSPFTDPYIFR